MENKTLFPGQIFEIEFLMELHILRTLESKNHVFRYWKSKASNSRKFKVDILNSGKLSEILYEDRPYNLYVGTHKRILIHCSLREESLFSVHMYISTALNAMK